MSAFCAHCGQALSPGAKFCGACGRNVKVATLEADKEKRKPEASPITSEGRGMAGKNNTKGLLIAGALILAVILALLLSSSKTPGETVERFLRESERGSEAVVNLVSKEVIGLLGRDKLVAGLTEERQKFMSRGGISQVLILEDFVNGNQAVVKSLVIYGDGSNREDKWNLVKEGGQWKITFGGK